MTQAFVIAVKQPAPLPHHALYGPFKTRWSAENAARLFWDADQWTVMPVTAIGSDFEK